MIVPRIQCDLQTVVVGPVHVRHVENIGEVREFSEERCISLLIIAVRSTVVVTSRSAGKAGAESAGTGIACSPSRPHRRLVDVADSGEIRSPIADICHLHRQVRGEGMLQAHRPVPYVRRCKVAVHRHDGTWAVIGAVSGCGVYRALIPWNLNRIQEVLGRDVPCDDGAA